MHRWSPSADQSDRLHGSQCSRASLLLWLTETTRRQSKKHGAAARPLVVLKTTGPTRAVSATTNARVTATAATTSGLVLAAASLLAALLTTRQIASANATPNAKPLGTAAQTTRPARHLLHNLQPSLHSRQWHNEDRVQVVQERLNCVDMAPCSCRMHTGTSPGTPLEK